MEGAGGEQAGLTAQNAVFRYTADMSEVDPLVEEARAAGEAYIDSFKGDRAAMLADFEAPRGRGASGGGKVCQPRAEGAAGSAA
jgi:hypothetical protein